MDEIDQSIQFIQEPDSGANTSFGIPGRSFFGILKRVRMESNFSLHHPFSRVRN